jgi:hypothetical protein
VADDDDVDDEEEEDETVVGTILFAAEVVTVEDVAGALESVCSSFTSIDLVTGSREDSLGGPAIASSASPVDEDIKKKHNSYYCSSCVPVPCSDYRKSQGLPLYNSRGSK